MRLDCVLRPHAAIRMPNALAAGTRPCDTIIFGSSIPPSLVWETPILPDCVKGRARTARLSRQCQPEGRYRGSRTSPGEIGSCISALKPPPLRFFRCRTPPCRWATRSTMASPSPDPGTPACVPVPPRRNGCRIRSISGGVTPGPLSRISICTASAEYAYDDHEGSGVIAHGVVHQIDDRAQQRARAHRHQRQCAQRQMKARFVSRLRRTTLPDERIEIVTIEGALSPWS